jgi:hypothetical protein
MKVWAIKKGSKYSDLWDFGKLSDACFFKTKKEAERKFMDEYKMT